MKKYLVLLAAMFFSFNLAQAVEFGVPAANQAQPALPGYGGVNYSTSSFSVQYTSVTHFIDQVSTGLVYTVGTKVYGVQFSTGQLFDFVDLWDATSTVNTVGLTPIRIYNVANGTGTLTTGGIATAAGYSSAGPLGIPIRFKRGLIWKASSALYNSIAVYYWKDND